MPQRGAYANRNAGHKQRQARLFAEAAGDAARLVAAFDWFRSSVRLMSRRRAPEIFGKHANAAAAAQLVREMTDHLKRTAEAIDRGEHDAK